MHTGQAKILPDNSGDRTRNLLFASPMFSQLCYEVKSKSIKPLIPGSARDAKLRNHFNNKCFCNFSYSSQPWCAKKRLWTNTTGQLCGRRRTPSWPWRQRNSMMLNFVLKMSCCIGVSRRKMTPTAVLWERRFAISIFTCVPAEKVSLIRGNW